MVTWAELASVICQVCVALAINNRPEYVMRGNELIDEWAAAVDRRPGSVRRPHEIWLDLDFHRKQIGQEIYDEARRVRAIFEGGGDRAQED